jgi:hypothetical protein
LLVDLEAVDRRGSGSAGSVVVLEKRWCRDHALAAVMLPVKALKVALLKDLSTVGISTTGCRMRGRTAWKMLTSA